jgi:peptide deformylase
MLEILTEENKLLRKKSKRVDKIDDSVRNLCASLVDTMLANNGVGLAAPQCGIHKRIIVVLINEQPKVLINPEIIFFSDDKEVAEEGCLSIPEKFIQKKRYSKITIKYRNLAGHPNLETHEGFNARVIQHEIDHLDGILMTDEELAQ